MQNLRHYFFCFLFLITAYAGGDAVAQTVPQGITYQGVARNSSGNIISSQPVSVKLGIYSPSVSGTLQWEEIHHITTNQLGLFYLVIGQGTSTGAGNASSFAAIGWGSAAHFIKIAVDQAGGSSFVDVDTMQFWAVPYAMYSQNSGGTNQSFRLNDLLDTDTLGVNNGYVLKWNGALWVPAPDNDSDTASYAANSAHSVTSDTAGYALNGSSAIDTVMFAYNSDTALFSNASTSSLSSANSDYCDTATYALNTGNAYTYWNLTGNAGTSATTNFVGTTDNADVVMKTNNLERMRITAAGKIGIGTASPLATVHIVGNDGVLATGTFGSGATAPSGVGTRLLWYPKKAAFRAGGVISNQWDDNKIGNYSFAASYSTTASGNYSTAFGKSCTSSGANSISAGDVSVASGTSSVAMGSVCQAQGAYSVALGRSALATDSSSIAMGYTLTASGKHAMAFGGYTTASGDYSVAMGYHASTNGKRGSFIFADMSSATVTSNTVDNQFMVRASGGVVLYSNAGMSSGVSLAAGGGSWASVSDKHKKENFKKENAENVLKKVSGMEVTSWNYKTQAASIRHIGPMAQDFYGAFHFGDSDTTITTVDIDGISLLAIQALAKKTTELKQKAEEVEALKARVASLEKEKSVIEKRVSLMEQQVQIKQSTALNAIKKDE